MILDAGNCETQSLAFYLSGMSPETLRIGCCHKQSYDDQCCSYEQRQNVRLINNKHERSHKVHDIIIIWKTSFVRTIKVDT